MVVVAAQRVLERAREGEQRPVRAGQVPHLGQLPHRSRAPASHHVRLGPNRRPSLDPGLGPGLGPGPSLGWQVERGHRVRVGPRRRVARVDGRVAGQR